MICALVIMINMSSEPWNKRDERNYRQASVTCGVKYKDAPCLRQFIKKEPGVYEALCGPRERRHHE